MKATIGVLAACLGVFCALLFQQALPAIHVLHGARFVVGPMIFCYAAVALPFTGMLVVAFFTGLLSDLMYLNVVGGRVEIALGCSIVYFVILGSIANGFRPSYLRGLWWPTIPLSVLGTWGYLLMQFVMISFRREGFVYEEAVLWRLVVPGLLSALCVPLLHSAVNLLPALVSGDYSPGMSRR